MSLGVLYVLLATTFTGIIETYKLSFIEHWKEVRKCVCWWHQAQPSTPISTWLSWQKLQDVRTKLTLAILVGRTGGWGRGRNDCCQKIQFRVDAVDVCRLSLQRPGVVCVPTHTHSVTIYFGTPARGGWYKASYLTTNELLSSWTSKKTSIAEFHLYSVYSFGVHVSLDTFLTVYQRLQ